MTPLYSKKHKEICICDSCKKKIERRAKRETWNKIEKTLRKTHKMLSEGEKDGFETTRKRLHQLMIDELGDDEE